MIAFETQEKIRGIILVFFLLFVLVIIPEISAKSPYRRFSVKPESDPIDQALQSLGLTRETCVFPLSGAAVASDKQFESPIYRHLLYHPFDIPYYMGHVEYNFECYRENLLRTMIFMASRSGASVARGYFTKPLESLEKRLENTDFPLLTALDELWALEVDNGREAYGKTPFSDTSTSPTIHIPLSVMRKLRPKIKNLPRSVRFEAARLLITTAQSVRWQKKAISRARKSPYKHLLEDIPRRLTPGNFQKDSLSTITEDWERRAYSDLRPLMGLVDFRYLMCGALDLMNALEKTRETFLKKKVKERFHLSLDTPLGRVVLNGDGEDNKYSYQGNYLLILDFGGNDLYQGGGANLSFNEPVSMLLDFQGNDTYIQSSSSFKPAFGAGIFGYGLLLDFDGDDQYLCPQFTEGAGYFGVGWLVDFSGDDAYESIRYAQGFAHGGLGLLYDRVGNDAYYSYNSSQGCGETRGCGMLVDEQGDDEYIAEDDNIRFPSAQSRSHNRSSAQGAGMGERSDEMDGHSLPGGVGILLDRSGDDEYTAGVFAQGMGYWNGVGLFMDSGGNDQYQGAWYVQGAGIHGGIGALCDRDGNDPYTVSLHASLGLGHDNAIGIFIDEKGYDLYNAPRLSLGTGNANSLGFFFELGGDDRYRCPSAEAMGRGQFSKWGTLREDRLNVGLFIDAGGKDEYVSPHGGNDRGWRQQATKGIMLKSESGVGLDGEFEAVDLRMAPLTEKPPNVEW